MINNSDSYTDSSLVPQESHPLNKIHLIKQHLSLVTPIIEWNLLVSLMIFYFTVKVGVHDSLYIEAIISSVLSISSLIVTYVLYVLVIPVKTAHICHGYMLVLLPLLKHLSFIPTVITVSSFAMRILTIEDNIQTVILMSIGIYFIITCSLQLLFGICSEVHDNMQHE